MVTGTRCLKLICLGLLLSASVLQARDPASYYAGDTAEETISTPVAMDVIDADATAARKTIEALKTPAIFRSYANPSNAIAANFLAAFDQTRALFATNLHDAFGEITDANATVAAPAFTGFVTAFNRKKIPFPVSTELAGVWAHGGTGEAIQARCLNTLMQMTHRPIRPDDLPDGVALGETLRLVSVDSPQQALNLAEAEQRGKLATVTSVTTITRLRDLFRRAFPQPEQIMARGIGKFLQTNCEPDANLTRQARERDTSQLVVVNHYDAGQQVVKRGEIIDAKTLAALVQLNEKLMPGQLNLQLAAQREQLRQELLQRDRLQQEQTQAQREQSRAEAAQAAALLKARDQQLNLQNQTLAARVRNEWLFVAIAGVSLGAIFAFWFLSRQRRREMSQVPVRLEKLSPESQAYIQATLHPQVAQILKEAVVQGLAAQRHELLQAQQAAAAELGMLVQRLDELKAPMQERLRSYEERIAELEKDLAERNEENRELLKLKIEMTRRQLEAERARNRVDFN
jgi:hypothetical protein